MKHIIDPELILGAPADYKYGRRLGLTDEESERSALETMDAMKQAYDKTLPVKPRYFVDIYGHNRPGCPGCSWSEILYAGQKYCSVCGTVIDWEVSE